MKKTRRRVLKNFIGITASAGLGLPNLLPASATARTRLAFDVPAGACDCHVHVFADTKRFPYVESRTYTPEPATAEELAGFMSRVSMDRAVIVTPSVYGIDNSATLDAISRVGQTRARGVAVVDSAVSESELNRLHQAGFRGARLFLGVSPSVDREGVIARLVKTAQALSGSGWHLQLYTKLSVLEALKQQISSLNVPIVLDHFAGADGAPGVNQAGFETVLEWLRTGKAYVKLSGPYYGSSAAPAYHDMAPLARAFIKANPERVLWGSDWPHPGVGPVSGLSRTDPAPHRTIDDEAILNQLDRWVADAQILRTILVDNPQRLYGFR